MSLSCNICLTLMCLIYGSEREREGDNVNNKKDIKIPFSCIMCGALLRIPNVSCIGIVQWFYCVEQQCMQSCTLSALFEY